jgi:hypothetical protein
VSRNLYEPKAKIGDWLEVSGPPGTLRRPGRILAVLGNAGHAHFRVRWDEEHESLFYSTDARRSSTQLPAAHKPNDEEAGT